MPAVFGTQWTGKPELHYITDSSTGRKTWFFDKAPVPRTHNVYTDYSGSDNSQASGQAQDTDENGNPTFDDPGYDGGTIDQARQAWQQAFPGVAFPDPSTATPGQGTNAQGNGTPGEFNGQEMTERGNAGHGSWMDQQGGEILSDVLRGVAGFVSGGLSELMFAAAGSDGSAEDKRGARAGAVGGLANSALDNIANSSASTAAPAATDAATSTSATTTSTTGLSSSPAQTAGVADTPAQALNPSGLDGYEEYVPSSGPSASPEAAVSPAPAGTPPPQSPGLIDTALKFAKDNKEVTAGAMQIGGGLLKGIGDRAGANERLDKTIQAQKDLEQQRLQNQMDLQKFLRLHTQSGSFFDTALPFRPGANTPLKRPGGANVYTSDGLIARGMR
jgi:hypothetical protein